MKWDLFFQLIISFILFICSIIIFKLLTLDVNFIVTFILAIFSLSISIFFFMESHRFSGIVTEKLAFIQEGVSNLKINREKVEGLNISDTLNFKEGVYHG